MFFSRTQVTPLSRSVAASISDQPGTSARQALEAAFGAIGRTPAAKDSAVGEMLDIKITEPVHAEFSEEVRILGISRLIMSLYTNSVSLSA